PARTLVPLPDELSFVEGAAVSCGTGTAYGALRRMQLTGGSTLAVFGQGPVGLSATLLGAKMGARVIAVETNPERLALAKQFGAEVAVHADDSEKALKDLTRGEGVDLALERIFRHRWKLEQADEAYGTFDTQSTGKGVIVF